MLFFDEIKKEQLQRLVEASNEAIVSQFVEYFNNIRQNPSISWHLVFTGTNQEMKEKTASAIADILKAQFIIIDSEVSIYRIITNYGQEYRDKVLYFKLPENKSDKYYYGLENILKRKTLLVILSGTSNQLSENLTNWRNQELIGPNGHFDFDILQAQPASDATPATTDHPQKEDTAFENPVIETKDDNQPISSPLVGPYIDYSNQLEQIQRILSLLQSQLANIPTQQVLDQKLKVARDESLADTQSILRQVGTLINKQNEGQIYLARDVQSSKDMLQELRRLIYEQNTRPSTLDTLSSRITQQQQAIGKISHDLSALSEMLVDEPKQNVMLENMQFNINQIAQGLSIAMNYEQLKRENEAYRADTNMKNFRRYGIDGLIKLYTNICTRIFQIENHIEDDTAEKLDVNTLQWMLRRIEKQFKPLGIILEKAETLEPMDETVMELFGEDEYDESLIIVPTTNPFYDHRVERSVVPAFVWTIPSVTSAPGNKWYLQPQKVCIYRYSNPIDNSQN